jgi:thioredoxin reductase
MSIGRQSTTFGHLWPKEKYPRYEHRGPSDGEFFGIPYRAMTLEECELEQDKFATAANRAKRAGFDGITFHWANGFLGQQFMSPATNKRTDKYGDRLLWVTETVKKVRAMVGPDFVLIARMSGQEYIPDGYEIDWFAKEACPALVEAGIDAIDVSAGTTSIESIPYLIPPIYQPRGILIPLAEAVKKQVKVPVFGVGKINDPQMVRSFIEQGMCDIVNLGRQSIADPDFPKKTLEGRDDEVRKCMFCDWCLYTCSMGNLTLECAENYEQGNFKEAQITKAQKLKRVLVIGGGIAGMEAARVAHLRGHDVTLWEKGPQLGGMVTKVSTMPDVFVGSLNNSVEWTAHQLAKHKVKVELNKEAAPDAVIAAKPDVVLLASGSRTPVPDIPGIKGRNVFTLEDYLDEKAKLGNRVAVLGGGYGAEIAVSIARGGKEVTLLSEGDIASIAAAPYLFQGARYLMLYGFLAQANINIITNANVKRITLQEVRYLDAEGNEQTVAADTVILATDRKPNRELYNALAGKVPELHDIGDCWRPGTIGSAIHDADHWSRQI